MSEIKYFGNAIRYLTQALTGHVHFQGYLCKVRKLPNNSYISATLVYTTTGLTHKNPGRSPRKKEQREN